VMELILWREGRVNRMEGLLGLVHFSEHFGRSVRVPLYGKMMGNL
jgi:hypothetical protein